MAIHAASVGATAAAIRATGVSAFKELGPLSLQRERGGGGGVGEVAEEGWVGKKGMKGREESGETEQG